MRKRSGIIAGMSKIGLISYVKTLFNDRALWRTMLALALPIALQNLLTSSLSLIDTVMVGSLGSLSISALGYGSQVTFFANIVMFGFSSGGAIFVAQYWGNRDMKGIAKSIGLLLTFNIPVSLLFFCAARFAPEFLISIFTEDALAIAEGAKYLEIASFSYIGVALTQTLSIPLRSTEDVKTPIIASGISVVLNTLLNYCFINGNFGFPAMGIEGAALATSISANIAAALLIVICLMRKNIIGKSIKDMFTFDWSFMKAFLKKSLPVLINETLWALGVLGFNMVLGRLGTDNYSALTITKTVENIAFVFYIGICHACNVTVAKNVGAGNIAQAKRHATQFMIIEPVLALLVGIMVLILRAPILSLFNISDAERTVAMALLLIYGIELGARNLPYIAVVGVFRGGGDSKAGMRYDLTCQWLIALPAVIISGLILKLDFVLVYLIMLLFEDIPKTVLCIRRFKSMKWIMPVTESGKRALELELEERV